MAKKKRLGRTPEEQAAYDERSRLIDERLAERLGRFGLRWKVGEKGTRLTADDQAAFDERTRWINSRIAERLAREREQEEQKL